MNQYRADRTPGGGAITSGDLTMSTNRLLGRTTAGTGAVEEITVVANAGMLFSSGNLQLDLANQTDMETPTSGNKIPKSTQLIYHPGIAKAWARWTADGSIALAYNVSSITDHGVGDWTVNISGSFPLSGTTGTILVTADYTAPLVCVVDTRTSASAYRVKCYDLTGTLADPTFMNFVIFGDCS